MGTRLSTRSMPHLLLAAAALAADSSFAVAGYGYAGASVGTEAWDTRFDPVVISPVLLWRHGDHVLIESEFAALYGEEGFDFSMEYASIDIDVGGPVFIAGMFLTPAGQFIQRQHPAWINKLPDFPLPYRVGPLPMNHVGFQLQHAVRLGPGKITGALWLDNGPSGDATTGPSLTPTVVDDNADKGVGGRLAVLHPPRFEVGGSLYTGAYGLDGGQRYLLWIVDASFTEGGWLDVRGEYARATWPDAAFDGAWVQAAWRLRQVQVLSRLEPVARFGYAKGDTIASAGHGHKAAPKHVEGASGVDVHEPVWELCYGLDYWLRPNVAVKASFTHKVEEWDPRIGLQLGWGM